MIGCRLLGAELAAPIVGVTAARTSADGKISHWATSDELGWVDLAPAGDAETTTFTCAGFVTKSLRGALPSTVRLLEDRTVAYQDRLEWYPGEKVDVRVHSSTPYRATLRRHGFELETVSELGDFEAAEQVVPDLRFVADGLDWPAAFSYTLPSDSRSGIYSVALWPSAEQRTALFAVPFVVSAANLSPQERAPLLVLASTNNWIAYNTWGGRSRYRNYEKGASSDFLEERSLSLSIRQRLMAKVPPRAASAVRRALGRQPVSQAWMHDPLSVARPFPHCALELDGPFAPFTNHLAAGEWRMLAWLERQGYRYDVVTGRDLHRQPDLLRHYRGLVLSTHCEYWSAEMYDAVRISHFQQGLWIVNCSGNSMYRQVEFPTEHTMRCSSLSFADSHADESELLGVRFTMDDYATCGPFRVVEPNHWVFQDAPLNPRHPYFGAQSLNQNTRADSERYSSGRPGTSTGLRGDGASGWETDKLTKSAPRDIVRVAKGANPRGGADMVVREPEGSRGGMFSASSLTFPGSLLVDAVGSQIVANVLNRVMDR